jgi:phosphoserine phosphatase
LFIATLVAAEELTDELLRSAAPWVDAPARVESGVWRGTIEGDPVRARAALERLPADIFVRAADAPEPRLLVADMDSTMITVECIDELADYAGVKPQVAEITERAMRGELDFAAALKARVALLKGLPETVLARCYDERVRITPGARVLVRTLKARGARAVLVSGGFTYFAERVAAEIGFDASVSNRLGVAEGRLDGTVCEPILGAEGKRAALLRAGAAAEAVAIGDGANDVPMLKAAGYGVAYHAKPAAAEAADAAVRFGDLTAVLHGLGAPRSAWVA